MVSESTEQVTAKRDSDFGTGIVVCLAKFSEHLWNGRDPSMQPDGEVREVSMKVAREMGEADPEAAALSHDIEMWANGASDHFYDLDDSAPEPLKELAKLTLEMGHGFTGKTWTKADMERVRDLWEESCLAVDRMLGVEADWGKW